MTITPIIDLALLEKRRLRRIKTNKDGADFLLQYVVREMDERLSLVKRKFEALLEVHAYHQDLINQTAVGEWANKKSFIDQFSGDNGDINYENQGLEREQFDLVISPLSLHLSNDTIGILVQFYKALQADGLLMAATLGAGTLMEMRKALLMAESEIYDGASARVIPFADIKDYGSLMQRTGFALPVIDSETLTVRYDDLYALMKDLRAMGMTNPLIDRSKKPVCKTYFQRANEIYKEKYSDPDGRIRASFVIIYLAGWKPHRNQQKPLKPGSGKIHLSEALNSGKL